MVEKIVKKSTTATTKTKTTTTTKTTDTKKPIVKKSTTATTTTTKPTTKTTTTKSTTTATTTTNELYKIGNKIEVNITEIRKYEVITKYKDYIGKIHFCNLAEQKESGSSILKNIKVGENITCWIIEVEDVAKILTLSMIENPKPATRQFKVGQQVDAIVYGQTSNNEITCWLSPTQIGTIEIISNFKDLKQAKQYTQQNLLLKCFIKSISTIDGKIYLSIGSESISNEKITIGNKMIGMITDINGLGLKVQLYNNLSGQVRMIDINEEIRTSPTSIYQVGMLIMVCVKSIGGSAGGILLSMYKSLIGLKQWEMNPKYKHPRTMKRSIHTEFSVGSMVWGFVIEKSEQIVRVELAGQLIAILQVDEIGPFVLHSFGVGELVRITITSEMTTEGSLQTVNAVVSTDRQITLKNIKPNDIIPLEIVDVKPYGLFVKNKQISGLAHISQLTDDDESPITPEQIETQFSVGDFVLGKCIGNEYSAEKRKKLIQFSLKQSNFQDVNMENYFKCQWDNKDEHEELFTPLKPTKLISILPIKSLLVEKQMISKLSTITEVDDQDEEMINLQIINDQEEQEEDDEFKSNKLTTLSSKKRKEIDSSSTATTNEEDEEIDEDDVIDKKKQKVEKSKSKNKQEQEIQEREDLLADHNVAPEGPQDFERMILGTPNSSYLWIKYMSYYLGLSEIGKAREIGERSIKKIIPTEVLEQRNIWIAMYNLENLYGTPDSLLRLFQRSIQYQDPKTMYLAIINILESTGKFDRVEEYFKMLFKKNGKHSSKVWCRYGEFLLKSSKFEVFNSILERALTVLPKKKQVKVINKFAQLEYKLGDQGRGRTIFEGLVSTYPSRTDIWNIYLDMELLDKESIKNSKESKDQIRTLFNRTIALKVSDRNIKQFFKRFLQFEKEFGSNYSINEVKKLALKFVESNN